MDWLVIVPVLALLALAFVSPGRRPPSLRQALVVWALGLVAFLSVRAFVPDEFLFGGSEPVRRIRAQIKHLLSRKDWDRHPILVLEGSSATQFGVDGIALEKELDRLGWKVTVLQFCTSGVNHFERLHMLESFFRALPPGQRAKVEAARVILLCEVFDAYDKNPLYLLAKSACSERSIVYLTPRNAWDGWRAWSLYAAGLRGHTVPEPVAGILVEHVLFNRFGVGAFSSMRWPDRRKRTDAFFPLEGAKENFKFAEAREVYLADPRGPVYPNPLPLPQWSACYADLNKRLSGWVDEIGFYALPTLETSRLSYQYAFSQARPLGTRMAGPADPSFMNGLMLKEYWFDGSHPTGQGAKPITEWLADELAEKWPR